MIGNAQATSQRAVVLRPNAKATSQRAVVCSPYSKARSFVVIMIMVAIVALILRLAIIQFINFNITQNEANAVETLKLIATALENYAKDHLGIFPTNFKALIQTKAYIKKEYLSLSYEKGYNFNCLRLETSGYTCSATPARCNLNGKKIYTITSGQVLATEECAKPEGNGLAS